MEAPALIAAKTLKGDFKYCLECHLLGGYVYSSPTVFGMARPVSSEWDLDTLNDPQEVALTEDADAWYFMFVTGNAAEAFSRLPFPLRHCMWHRERTQKLQKIPYERLQHLLSPKPRRTIGFLQ